MHALDAGAVGGDAGSWTFLFVMLFVTAGGLFVLSALIGILNNGFGALIENLRRGKSVVIEHGHVAILGWSPKIDTLLAEPRPPTPTSATRAWWCWPTATRSRWTSTSPSWACACAWSPAAAARPRWPRSSWSAWTAPRR